MSKKKTGMSGQRLGMFVFLHSSFLFHWLLFSPGGKDNTINNAAILLAYRTMTVQFKDCTVHAIIKHCIKPKYNNHGAKER